MMSQCNCHCDITNHSLLYLLSLIILLINLCLEIDKIIKREVVYSSCFLTVFQPIFHLYQEFMFLCAFSQFVFFWCLDYFRTNEQIFIKIVVSRTWSKEVVTNFQ